MKTVSGRPLVLRIIFGCAYAAVLGVTVYAIIMEQLSPEHARRARQWEGVEDTTARPDAREYQETDPLASLRENLAAETIPPDASFRMENAGIPISVILSIRQKALSQWPGNPELQNAEISWATAAYYRRHRSNVVPPPVNRPAP